MGRRGLAPKGGTSLKERAPSRWQVGDQIDRDATQVGRTGRGSQTVHRLLCAAYVDGMGRQYKTACHRYLYADEGAVLTTLPADCGACADASIETGGAR